jgi:hypothetical protein
MQCTGRTLATISMLLLAGAALAQATQADKPIESAHRAGPKGLEGWTESYPLADGQSVPANLVIAQRRHVIRRIEGDPFIWKWMFWENGKQVAYETGSLHFNMACRLVDIASGRQLANLDCYRELADDAPAWAKALQNAK